VLGSTASLLALDRAEEYFEAARLRMVEKDLRGRGIHDRGVLEVMGRLPRHRFVNPGMEGEAYDDHPLPIGEGQTISQPYIVALMTQELDLGRFRERGARILEVGTGSAYQAAVLAEIAKEVYTMEIRPGLARSARSRLQELGYRNVSVRTGDGYFGWPEAAPFDGILVTAAANHIPPSLKTQLRDGGRLILPLGSTWYFQNLTIIEKKGQKYEVRHLIDVSFVPMVGEVEKGRK
jgi:protein-L-isoaspartate(D-aspartate) O-methyltransferase